MIKRRTLQYFYKLIKEKYGNRKKNIFQFFGNGEKNKRVFLLIITLFMAINGIIYISVILLNLKV